MRVWSPGRSRSHFSQTTTTTATTTMTTTTTTTTTTDCDVDGMSHRVYRPYGMFTLAKRTNGHMSESRLHNVSPALSPLRLSFSFGIFRCESVVQATRSSYRCDLNPFRCVRSSGASIVLRLDFRSGKRLKNCSNKDLKGTKRNDVAFVCKIAHILEYCILYSNTF